MNLQPIGQDQFKNKNILRVWERDQKQVIKKFDQTKKLSINLSNDKEVDSFTKVFYTTIKKAIEKFRDDTTDEMIDTIETAHNHEYKLTKEVDKDETVSIMPDNYDKFIEMEYGKNIPGARLVQNKYGRN